MKAAPSTAMIDKLASSVKRLGEAGFTAFLAEDRRRALAFHEALDEASGVPLRHPGDPEHGCEAPTTQNEGHDEDHRDRHQVPELHQDPRRPVEEPGGAIDDLEDVVLEARDVVLVHREGADDHDP